MKLPPVALTAPTLCPRCDTPALVAGPTLAIEHCIQCTMALRQCPRCRGVAGPFDRFCGFCGFEMLRARRSPLWRLWVLALLVPVAAAVAYVVLIANHAAGR